MLSVEASVAAVMQHMGTTAPTTTPLSLSLSFCRSRGAGFPPHATAHPFLAWKSLTLLVHLQGCRAEGKLGSGNKLEVQYIILKDVHHIAQPPFCVPLTWCPLAGALFFHDRLLSIDEALATGFACVAPAAPSFFHQGRRATGPPPV